MHLSNRLLSVIGLIGLIIAYSLMGDWQAMRPDPCTVKSIFHHPELQQQYMSQLAIHESSEGVSVAETILYGESNQSMAVSYFSVKRIYLLETITETNLTSGYEIRITVLSSLWSTRSELKLFSVSILLSFEFEH